jgi:hypothetical protein
MPCPFKSGLKAAFFARRCSTLEAKYDSRMGHARFIADEGVGHSP